MDANDLLPFLCNATTFAVFHYKGIQPVSKHFTNKIVIEFTNWPFSERDCKSFGFILSGPGDFDILTFWSNFLTSEEDISRSEINFSPIL